MHPYWVFWAEFAVVALESAAVLLIGYQLCKRYRWARYAGTIIGATCLCYRILTSTFPHRFYIESPYLILTGLITPAGFLLLAAGFTMPIRRSRQRVLLAVFSVVLSYYVFCDVAYLAIKGPEISRLAGQWERKTMRQSTSFTCGPAAAVSLLRAWGIMIKEGELAYAARTSFRGTELPRLTAAIRLFGRYTPLTLRLLSTTFDRLYEINRPAVLLVQKGGQRHAVTLLKMEHDELFIADPGSGGRKVHLADFLRQYQWNSRAILAWRTSAFRRLSDEPPDPRLHP